MTRGEYEHDYLPLAFRGSIRSNSTGTSSMWFPLPPYPTRLSPSNMQFTEYQMEVLKFLRAWHWRWNPNLQDIQMNTPLPRHNIVWSTVNALRSLDIVNWVENDARTLHLTPTGQRILGLYIGPVVLKEEPIETLYTVNTRTATIIQKQYRRKMKKLVKRKGIGRWNRIVPLSRLRRWLLQDIRRSSYVERSVPTIPDDALRQV